jgi:putative aldouronate transport system substrate-binding protein
MFKFLNAGKAFALLLAVALIASAGKSCGNPGGEAAPAAPGSAKPDKLELKIYAPGDRPRDMEIVLAEIEKQCPEEINIKPNLVFIPWSDLGDKTTLALTSGEDMELIFDAPWLHMDQMYSQGMYQNLDPFIEEYGQNLVKARGEIMWNANKWDGHTIGIPFGDTYGGSRAFYVRKDLREKLGIAPLKTHKDLIDYLYKVRDEMPDIIPYSMNSGALDNNWSSWTLEQTNGTSMIGHSPGGVGQTFLLYTVGLDSIEVKNILDEPNDIILGVWHEARKLYQDKIINPDILAETLTGEDQFASGKIACFVSNSAAVNPSAEENLRANVPDGEIEVFSEWSYKPKTTAVDYKVYNFQCAPKNAKNTARAIQFLDWANSSQDIYDLFAYGIKGVNWEPVGDRQYTPLDGYPWFPFVWVMNPTQERYDSRLTPESVEITNFFHDPDNFVKSQISGFNFNSEDLATEMVVFSEVETKYMSAVGHGVLDPDETLEKIRNEAYDEIKKIQEELQKQLNDFVAANK